MGTSGRIVAIDGVSGFAVTEAAERLVKLLGERDAVCGLSRWDASGLFGDVTAAPIAERDVSPRTLALLFAADLAFRLRWEIEPALAQGHTVIVAPYLVTLVALGAATGLSREWLQTLLRFAPKPARTLVLRDRRAHRRWKRKPTAGFAECCATLLETGPGGFARKRARAVMVNALEAAADRHGGLIRKRDLKEVAAALSR